MNKELSSNNIINFRKKNNLTQKELAIFLNTTPSTICAYEKGKTLILTSFATKYVKNIIFLWIIYVVERLFDTFIYYIYFYFRDIWPSKFF